MKNIRLKLALLLALSVTGSVALADTNKIFRPDTTFADFEDLTHFFKKPHQQSVRIINHKDSPVSILRAQVSDKGTVFFKSMTGAVATYAIKVRNNTSRKILAYEVTWVLKHPFEDYVFHKIRVNSISLLEPNSTQNLRFRKDKHYRDDAYYYAEVSKVEFEDDESIWEAPELTNDKNKTQMDKIKDEIDSLDDDDLSNGDGINLKELKEEFDVIEGNEKPETSSQTSTTTTTTTKEVKELVEVTTTKPVVDTNTEDADLNKLLEEIDAILKEEGITIPDQQEQVTKKKVIRVEEKTVEPVRKTEPVYDDFDDEDEDDDFYDDEDEDDDFFEFDDEDEDGFVEVDDEEEALEPLTNTTKSTETVEYIEEVVQEGVKLTQEEIDLNKLLDEIDGLLVKENASMPAKEDINLNDLLDEVDELLEN